MALKTNRIGEKNINKKGYKMKIINYRGATDLDIEFEDGYIRKNMAYKEFKNGAVDHTDYSKRIGRIIYNNFGSKITVIDYKNSDNVIVQFENGYKSTVSWGNFIKGCIMSPYDKTFCGVGCLGEGEFTCDNKWYEYWRAMIERVNRPNDKLHRTYVDVSICDEWYNYQNFAKWASKNYYEIDNYKMELDKDILHKGNKIYSPANCVFVPQFINTLFVKADKSRGNLPIGVYWHERDQEYRSQCSCVEPNGTRKNKWLGGHDTQEKAFIAYKRFKEAHIKEIADRYKEKIPNKLYEAMYNYIVEITD